MKLIHALTVKLCDARKRFIENRARQMEMESGSEYIRHLIDADMEKAERDFILLGEALNSKVSVDYLENHEQ